MTPQTAAPGEEAPVLSLRGVSKSFPGVRALECVDLDFVRGEVHALVGENGAGKSSLLKVIAGIYQPDAGTVELDGAPYAPHTPHDALRAGVRCVYQELSLLEHLSVAENLLVEALPHRGPLLDRRELARQAERLLGDVGLDIPPSTPASYLGMAQKQLLEIAKALAGSPQILLLDEPTASLTPTETQTLFALVREMRAKGVTVVFISHHLEEVFELCDRVSVMRNGRHVLTCDVADTNPDELVRAMVGRDLAEQHPCDPSSRTDEVALAVNGLVVGGFREPVSFQVHEGEVLGIAGLAGAGRTELLRAVFGADPVAGGSVIVGGQEVAIRSPHDAVEHGIFLLTEERKTQGLLPGMSVAANISISTLGLISHGLLLDTAEEDRIAARLVDELAIATSSTGAIVSGLSGGNQQKVLVARALLRGARVLLLDEPTRGVDVGAKREIHLVLRDLAREGRAVVVVSSDLPELLGICHRVLVVSRGRIAGEVQRPDFDAERVLSLAYSEYVTEAARSGDPTSELT